MQNNYSYLHYPYRVPEAGINFRDQANNLKKKKFYKFVKLKSFETVGSDFSQILTIMCMSQAVFQSEKNISIE